MSYRVPPAHISWSNICSKISDYFSRLENCCSRPYALNVILVYIIFWKNQQTFKQYFWKFPWWQFPVYTRRVIHAVCGFTCLPQFPMSSSLGLTNWQKHQIWHFSFTINVIIWWEYNIFAIFEHIFKVPFVSVLCFFFHLFFIIRMRTSI